jgi:plasmid stabilization system protein ParE
VNLHFRPAAAADVEEAFLWYEAQRPGLGEEYLEAVSRALIAIRESPRLHGVIHRDVRRVSLRRFPYSVFYRILDQDVVVVGCFHASRDPRRWRRRR